MRLSPMTTAHQPRLSIPRPSAFAGPGPSSPRMIQVAVQRRDLLGGLLQKRRVFQHLQCRRTLTSSKLADSI
jgi:hypothetical protein